VFLRSNHSVDDSSLHTGVDDIIPLATCTRLTATVTSSLLTILHVNTVTLVNNLVWFHRFTKCDSIVFSMAILTSYRTFQGKTNISEVGECRIVC